MLFLQYRFDSAFSRADIMRLAGISSTPAGELIAKLKTAELITPVKGHGKGKYRFIRKYLYNLTCEVVCR